MIITNVSKIDKFFPDQFPDGLLVDIFGSGGVGKTQLVMQSAIHTASQNKQILFQDTTGAFRPERMLELIHENNLDPKILDCITVSRITNVYEQVNSISKIDNKKFAFIVIDNISDLFSFEYSNEDQFFTKNKLFSGYMKNLSSFAIDNKITVLLTNVVRNRSEQQVESLGKTIDLYTHVKIKLEKIKNKYRCICFTAFDKINFNFTIKPSGLSEIP